MTRRARTGSQAVGGTDGFRRTLLEWFDAARRDLPWRSTRDPYRIWVSEIMLQQTRAAAVIPYYARFLERFPTVDALAAASEDKVLAAWAGLGYYSRARNLQKAAREIVARGSFPEDYASVRAMPGVGDYTAAAIASIAFGLPHAALDGNVLRVLARLGNDASNVASPAAKRRFAARAEELLDRRRPGDFNQAMMELGATVCLPRQPRCGECPVAPFCEGRKAGTAAQLPVKGPRPVMRRVEHTLLVVRRNGRLLMWQRAPDSARLAGFWEMPRPEHLPGVKIGEPFFMFRHSITNSSYVFAVAPGGWKGRTPSQLKWLETGKLKDLALSTTTRKALGGLRNQGFPID